jgi:hypothetical protein
LLAWDGDGHVHNDGRGVGEGEGDAEDVEGFLEQSSANWTNPKITKKESKRKSMVDISGVRMYDRHKPEGSKWLSEG